MSNSSDEVFLTFEPPPARVVQSGPPDCEFLVVTPGGVPGVPGPEGPSSTTPGPPGPPGPEGPPGEGAVDIANHINDPTPHPAYDDIPSLVLLFENGLI